MMYWKNYNVSKSKIRPGCPKTVSYTHLYQKESKLLDDIRKKIRKEACQLDNIYAIYEYSTIKALRKANEQSPMAVSYTHL